MSVLLNDRKARLMGICIVISFLMIHVSLFFLFRHFFVMPMARFNVFSILFYVLIIPICDRLGYRFFGLAVYLEVLLHMAGAVIFTGWEGGFQNTLLGINILIFYNEYVMRRLKEPHVRALPVAFLGMLTYLCICVYAHHFPARYPLPESVSFWLQIIWGAIVFVITIAYLFVFVNLTSGSEEFLSEAVGHDKLTGLPNRYFVADFLDNLQDGAGLDGHWCAMVDIDDFKKINDTYGHDCGDFVLREMAQLLRETGEGIQASRWGGEEFLLFGPPGENPAACIDTLEALRRRVMEHVFIYDGLELHLTITIGFADYRPGGSIRGWINAADSRLYEGKRSGKNRVVV